MNLRQQFRNNLLAIISLVVALAALSYNTWRNELTEHNRNIRFAGFEIITHLGELQRITYLVHYDKALDRQTPRDGWAEVLVLQDLSQIMLPEVPRLAQALLDNWRDNWQDLGKTDLAVSHIDNAINDLRKETLRVVRALD